MVMHALVILFPLKFKIGFVLNVVRNHHQEGAEQLHETESVHEYLLAFIF